MHLRKVDVVSLRVMASAVTQLQQAVGNLPIKAQNMYLESQICSGDLVELSGVGGDCCLTPVYPLPVTDIRRKTISSPRRFAIPRFTSGHRGCIAVCKEADAAYPVRVKDDTFVRFLLHLFACFGRRWAEVV